MSAFISYQHLAQVYDRLMTEAPYDQWIDYAQRIWAGRQQKPVKVADLACGTGSISIPLAGLGYEVTGIDLSEEMLAVTYDKAREKSLSIQLLHQDMRDLALPYEVDAIVSFCDSLNYLTEPGDILQTFRRVHQALKPGGVFLFDVHSIYKINHVFADQTFTLVEDDICYIWDCSLVGEEKVTHDLTIFVKEGQLYKRFEEMHVQQGYSHEAIVGWLEEAGFRLIDCSADFTEEAPTDESERIFYAAEKMR
ncbi:class I SAM-dependent methyltransferase [Ammoniphilus sp. 3BR4]|uniref:class I SAM-dependent DNA methyltransferase n=1 Tax=Ammoniphilus sp. 3BR4 TaxID=3158265 RepID=UPI0034651CEC